MVIGDYYKTAVPYTCTACYGAVDTPPRKKYGGRRIKTEFNM